jgi:hypothetical protein
MEKTINKYYRISIQLPVISGVNSLNSIIHVIMEISPQYPMVAPQFILVSRNNTTQINNNLISSYRFIEVTII